MPCFRSISIKKSYKNAKYTRSYRGTPIVMRLFFVNKKSQLLGIAGKLTLQEVMSKFQCVV
ncbi:hypothetical protein CXF80_17270 [Shewanella sp. Actino-trap-3]|uniref:Uncharacterized protein n=1 Tax=Shewanella psychromarinicola TaxID=2487742 RepID=A0A3N4E8L9_9GAMM|nr:hypothetical protein CXF80_17270 [Shewanella sp. Actino-trap-3]RPA33287.1 hypothetical protein EGC77_08070 [Shewanella psychromarinicola]